MSHVVVIKTEVRDPLAVDLACWRLKLPDMTWGTAKFYADEATGWLVRLPEWKYPVVCDTTEGRLHFDNFEGRWGPQERLDAFLQAYAVEKTRLEARKQGYSIVEQALSDGSVKLTIEVGGAA